MTPPKYRNALPQLSNTRLLTDGGIETCLIFHDGLDLPYFAAFTLLETQDGREALRRYYENYIRVAHEQGAGFILDSATWRASADWGQHLGYSTEQLAEANRQSIELLHGLRMEHEKDAPFVISGNIGPRGDGYVADQIMTVAEAAAYHAGQIAVFEKAGVDMISAITMTHAEEAAGIAQACAKWKLPLALAFTLETDGRLPSGQELGEAIAEVDGDGSSAPAYYMINCAHPDHFRAVLAGGTDWVHRIRGLCANASRMSHAELDAAETLDDGDPVELGQDYAGLLPLLPNLRVFGGCCGTDHRHIREIGRSCIATPVP
ncbi:MAG: homocysteine S-methyltransferase family protein [Pseudomonadota bacterium]